MRPAASAILAIAAILYAPALDAADNQSPTIWRTTAHSIFERLIAINTADSTGSTTTAAEAVATILKSAGWPEGDIHIVGSNPRRKNLIARYRGTGEKKPILLLAHLDVVEARPSDWSFPPFKLTETGGYFYGRGSEDDKCMDAIWIATLLRLRQEGVRPDRDIITALTAGEESGIDNGVAWLLKNSKPLIDADFAFNEGGGGQTDRGKKILNAVQASEKTYGTWLLTATGPGGHSSQPVKTNVIYEIAQALGRLRDYEFPPRLTEVTKAFFSRMSKIETGQAASDVAAVIQTPPDQEAVARLSRTPYYNALLRTTCVATMIEGGHAENALPQSVTATVNCRILPGEPVEQVERTLVRVIDDSGISIKPAKKIEGAPPSPLPAAILKPIQDVTAEMWPGVPVVPVMSTGATDGKYLRLAGIPTYGVNGLFEDVHENRAHGKDERIPVASFYESQEFLYRLIKRLSTR